MFTGIIQGIGIVINIKKMENLHTITVKFPIHLLKNLKVGSSVANNGCCLTVSVIEDDNISFDIMKETLRITNLSFLSLHSKVNLERSLKYGDEIGGHLISGHINNTAIILNIINTNYNKEIIFELDNQLMKYIFEKGFIAVDGISLTISNIYKNSFSIFFIPETVFYTNIKEKQIQDIVNIEIDYYTKIVMEQITKKSNYI